MSDPSRPSDSPILSPPRATEISHAVPGQGGAILVPPTGLVAPGPDLGPASGPRALEVAREIAGVRRGQPPEGFDRRDFERELERLLRAYADGSDNPGSVSCKGCRRCAGCMFCEDCEDCYRCTHSRGCRRSTHLTHCIDCEGCHDCAHGISSEDCTRSNYLVLSRGCCECNYCFGCVGLQRKDFHILNEPYSRDVYFRTVKALQAELGLPG